MFRDETFRRVRQVHESGRSAYVRAARRDSATGGGVPQASRREPASPRPETWLKEETEGAYAAFRLGPRCSRSLERCFRFFVLLRGQFCISEPLADDLRAEQVE